MGIEALTRRDDGTNVPAPQSEDDWQEWANPGDIRNWMLDDPLIDWLQLYGGNLGYIPKEEVESYDGNLDFGKFVAERAAAFRAGILRLLAQRYETTTIARNRGDRKRLDRARESFAAMQRGVPIIHRPALRDAENRNYGSPDFLVRSDVLHELFPEDISVSEATTPAADLGGNPWHYRVVNVKYMTLHLNAAGTELGNAGNAAHKAELYLLNRMLGRLQGYLPPASYALGRGWTRTQRRQTYGGDSALERLGPVPQGGSIARGVPIADAVDRATEWVRRLRTEGKEWQLLPTPSVPELYPNMKNSGDGDLMTDRNGGETAPEGDDGASAELWIGAKQWLARDLKELTRLWRVGVAGREKAHSQGIYRWDDPRVTPEAVGVGGETNGPILEQLLAVNTADGPPVRPGRIERERAEWQGTPAVEFYVDFEFCGDLNDDFTNLPQKGGQPLIFMIGCGHVENGAWSFASLVAHELSLAEEARIIAAWLEHMATVRGRLAPENRKPRVFHWSNAETNAFRSAGDRHPGHAWPELGWYDFLAKVMRAQPVVVRGALDFGLKSVAQAMHRHGLIETGWDDGNPVDGLGAMVGAWRCDAEARQKGVPMTALPLMTDIADYNEVDCKVMMEIVQYLRQHH